MAWQNNTRPFDTVKMQGRNGPGSRSSKIQAPPRALSTPMPNGAPPVPTATNYPNPDHRPGMYGDDVLDVLSGRYAPQPQTASKRADAMTPKAMSGFATPPPLPALAPNVAYPNPDHQPQQIGGGMYPDTALDQYMAQSGAPVYQAEPSYAAGGADFEEAVQNAAEKQGASKPGGGEQEAPYAVETNDKGMWLDQYGEWHPAGDTPDAKHAAGVAPEGQQAVSPPPEAGDTYKGKVVQGVYDNGQGGYLLKFEDGTSSQYTEEGGGSAPAYVPSKVLYAAEEGLGPTSEDDVDQQVIDKLFAGLDTTPGISDEALAGMQSEIDKDANLAQANLSQQMAASGLVGSGAEGYGVGNIDVGALKAKNELGFKTEQFNADQMAHRIDTLAGLYQGDKGNELAAQQLGMEQQKLEAWLKDNSLSNAFAVLNNVSAAVGAKAVSPDDLPGLLDAIEDAMKDGTPLGDALAKFGLEIDADGKWQKKGESTTESGATISYEHAPPGWSPVESVPTGSTWSDSEASSNFLGPDWSGAWDALSDDEKKAEWEKWAGG